MAVTIAQYQTDVRYAGKTTEVVIGRRNPGVAVAQGPNDYSQRSPPPADQPRG